MELLQSLIHWEMLKKKLILANQASLILMKIEKCNQQFFLDMEIKFL